MKTKTNRELTNGEVLYEMFGEIADVVWNTAVILLGGREEEK